MNDEYSSRLAGVVLIYSTLSVAQGPMAFTVSIDRPDAHIFHVTLRSEGLAGELHDFKLPAWAPAYYRVLDYAKRVSHFHAQDGEGHASRGRRSRRTRGAW